MSSPVPSPISPTLPTSPRSRSPRSGSPILSSLPSALPSLPSSGVADPVLRFFNTVTGAATEMMAQFRESYKASAQSLHAHNADLTSSTILVAKQHNLIDILASMLKKMKPEHTPLVPPAILCDPLTGTLITEPSFLESGESGENRQPQRIYSRASLTAYIEQNHHVPGASEPCAVTNIVSHTGIQSYLDKYLQLRRIRIQRAMSDSYVGGISGQVAVPIDPPAIAQCQISGKLITKAVITPEGTICDEQALLKHLSQSKTEPKKPQIPLIATQVHDLPELTERIATYRRLLEAQYCQRFRSDYHQVFTGAGFLHRNPFSTMRWKLWWNENLTFAEILQYVNENPGTRSSRIIAQYRQEVGAIELTPSPSTVTMRPNSI